MVTTMLGAAVVAAALSGAPSPGHGIYSDLVTGVPLTNGNLLNTQPYPPYARPKTVTYTNGGRLWAPATAADKIYSSLYPGGGPATVGADLGLADARFFVRPNSEPFPDVILSPWQQIDQTTFDDLTRRRPWLRRSPSRTDGLIMELRAAQNEWLRQTGYINHVRTHVNARSLDNDASGAESNIGSAEPSAVIKLKPAKPAPTPEQLRTSVPDDNPITRISMPGQDNEPRITVVRKADEDAEANAGG